MSYKFNSSINLKLIFSIVLLSSILLLLIGLSCMILLSNLYNTLPINSLQLLYTIFPLSLLTVAIIYIIKFPIIRIDTEKIKIGTVSIPLTNIQTIRFGNKITLTTKEQKIYKIDPIGYSNGHLIKLNLKVVEPLIYGSKKRYSLFNKSPISIKNKTQLSPNDNVFKLRSTLYFYHWTISLFLGLPFLVICLYSTIYQGKTILILFSVIPISGIYIYLSLNGHYFTLTSHSLLIFNYFLPGVSYAFNYSDIVSIEEGSFFRSLAITTKDYKKRQFATYLSAKKLKEMLTMLSKKASEITILYS